MDSLNDISLLRSFVQSYSGRWAINISSPRDFGLLPPINDRLNSTSIADKIEHLSPPSSGLLKNQVTITVKAALRRKYFANAIAVQIELIDKVDAR